MSIICPACQQPAPKTPAIRFINEDYYICNTLSSQSTDLHRFQLSNKTEYFMFRRINDSFYGVSRQINSYIFYFYNIKKNPIIYNNLTLYTTSLQITAVSDVRDGCWFTVANSNITQQQFYSSNFTINNVKEKLLHFYCQYQNLKAFS